MVSRKRKISNIDVFLKMTKRNFLVFAKNKVRMFYTLLVPVIILFIYVLFLRQLEYDSISKAIPGIPESTIYAIMDAWFLSGVVALSSITMSIQTNNIIIDDKEKGINRDFASAPIHKTVVTLSYLIFNFIVTFGLCSIFVLVSFAYLGIKGEFLYSFPNVLLIFAMLLFICLNAASFNTLLCSFVNREVTYNSFISILSACLGFLIGCFMPLSLMPKVLQDICFFIPGSQCTALMRYAYLAEPLKHFSSTVDPAKFEILRNQVGYNLIFYVKDVLTAVDLTKNPIYQGGVIISPAIQCGIAAGYTTGFIGFSILNRKHTLKTNVK